MNILIVEDEIKTLQGIQKVIQSIPADYKIAGTCRSAEEGVRLALSLRPDLIMTDVKMPGGTGLDMIRTLQEKGFFCKYLILSGYADFSFARDAMLLGCVDYLLKPLTVTAIKKALEKVDILLHSEQTTSYPKDMSQQELFGYILRDNGQIYVKEFVRKTSVSRSQMLLLFRSGNRLTQNEMTRLEKYLADFLRGNRCVSAVLDDRRDLYCLLDVQEPLSAVDKIVKLIHRDINEYLVASAEIVSDMTDLPSAAKRLKEYSNWNLTLRKDGVIGKADIDSLKCISLSYPEKLEKRVTDSISSDDPELTSRRIDDFLKELCKETVSYADIREALIRLTVAVLFEIRTENYGIYENISHLHLMEWLQEILCIEHYRQVILNIIRMYQVQARNIRFNSNPVIYKAMKIIGSEYSGDISQEGVARRLNITPEYLSSLFMKEVGINYTVYCNQQRIEAAKKMLQESGKKIYEAAEASGFKDVTYFGKVFKKYVGVSPGEYQRSHT